jgi:hypothetical protein
VAIALGPGDGLFQLLLQAAVVEQMGQRVVVREPGEPELGALARGDVHPDREDQGLALGLSIEDRVVPDHIEVLPVLGAQIALLLEVLELAGDQIDEVSERPMNRIVTDHELGEGLALQLFSRIPRQHPGMAVRGPDDALACLGQDDDLPGFEHAGDEVAFDTQLFDARLQLPVQGLELRGQRDRGLVQDIHLVAPEMPVRAESDRRSELGERRLRQERQVAGRAPEARQGPP